MRGLVLCRFAFNRRRDRRGAADQLLMSKMAHATAGNSLSSSCATYHMHDCYTQSMPCGELSNMATCLLGPIAPVCWLPLRRLTCDPPGLLCLGPLLTSRPILVVPPGAQGSCQMPAQQ
jgi:hypothetical protein